MPSGFAGDPAPQQLTAPCRKYQAALRHPVEQPVYRTRLRTFQRFSSMIPGAHHRRVYGTVCAITFLIQAGIVLARPVSRQEAVATATVRGIVVDARTGAPLRRILVSIEGGPSVQTADDGAFSLTGVPSGAVRLYVSAVGYGLVLRTLQLAPGSRVDLRIPLSEGASTYTEALTVTADRFRRPETGVPGQQTLGSAELQNLRGVLADDALRAVQVLPGVATGDDFRSEFSVRGSDFAHLNFTVDGFATPFLMHMVRAVEDRANTGSVAMINGDVLDEVTLLNAGYPQRSGNRTGAELAFTMREGSRDRTLTRLSVSGTNASAVVEGPLGRAHKGSWLLSGRKSYLDLVVDRLSEEGLSFGFGDLQAKLRYDLTDRHSAALTFITGKSTLKELPQGAEDDDLFVGDNASAIVIGSWRAALGNGLLKIGLLGATNAFDNRTFAGRPLENGTNDQLAVRADVQFNLAPTMSLEAGGQVERVDELQRRYRLVSSTVSTVLNDYRSHAVREGAYARLQVAAGSRVVLSPGARVDYSHLTDQTTASPWLQSEVTLPRGYVLRAAGGVYQQFPDFEEVVGALAGVDMQPEKSIHLDAGLERRLSPSTRIQVTLYNRQDESVIRRPDADTRLESGRLVRGSRTATYANRLDGYARGAEFLVQRSSPSGLSGWVSYAYGRNRYEDRLTGEQYWGDLDQRHTFNAYVFYRFSHRFSVSAKYRMGSNFPIPGYYASRGDLYFISDRRNAVRLPAYARLDLRANRTFDWSRKRLTLFAEVINVLNKENVRFNPPRVATSTLQVTRLFDSLIPVIPSAGVLLEF
jgi:hypothetical protein